MTIEKTVVMDLDFIINPENDTFFWEELVPNQNSEIDILSEYEKLKSKIDKFEWRNLNFWFQYFNLGDPKKTYNDYHDLAELNDSLTFHLLNQLKESGFDLELHTHSDPEMIKIYKEKFPETFRLFKEIKYGDKYDSQSDLILDRTKGKNNALILPSNYHSFEVIQRLFPGRAEIKSPNVNGLIIDNPNLIPDLIGNDYPSFLISDINAKFLRLEHSDLNGTFTGHGYYKHIFEKLFLRIPISREAIKKAYKLYHQENIEQFEKLNNFASELIRKYSNKNESIIEYGCGEGTLHNMLKKHGYNNITLVDYINNSNTNSRFIEKDIFDLNLNERFNLAALVNVSHYYVDSDLDKFIKIIDQHLEKEGRIISISPQIDPHTEMKKYFNLIEQGMCNLGKDKINYIVLKK